MRAKNTLTVKVRLNGTSENSYKKLYGLKQNPFPQIATAESSALDWLINNLAAEPISDEAHLRERLTGAHPEFVELCVKHFKPGERTEFTIEVKI